MSLLLPREKSRPSNVCPSQSSPRDSRITSSTGDRLFSNAPGPARQKSPSQTRSPPEAEAHPKLPLCSRTTEGVIGPCPGPHGGRGRPCKNTGGIPGRNLANSLVGVGTFELGLESFVEILRWEVVLGYGPPKPSSQPTVMFINK